VSPRARTRRAEGRWTSTCRTHGKRSLKATVEPAEGFRRQDPEVIYKDANLPDHSGETTATKG
jgi:hypothetical protein